MNLRLNVHNIAEVKALIKESFARGDEYQFDGAHWLTHAGEPICQSVVRHTEFELVLTDRSSLTIEVL